MERNFAFSFGLNNFLPSVVDNPSFFVNLTNISPEDLQLKCLEPRLLTHNVVETVTQLAFTFEAKSRFADIFAFCDNSVKRIDESINPVNIFTTPQTSTQRWATVQWRNEIYFSRLDVPLRKVAGAQSLLVDIVTNPATTTSNGVSLQLSARYAIAGHDHLWLGHVIQNGTLKPTSVRWSDLYNPDRWEISETSESDEFSLSVNDLEITGLEMHRNQVVIFTTKSIWIAKYEGLPTVYGFEPLYSNLGCGYHYSVARVNENLYFIGTDGVYKLNSFQLTDIGAPVWNSLKEDLRLLTEAPSVVLEIDKLVYWLVGNKTYVYNYQEDRWAIYDFRFLNCSLTIPGTLARTTVIDAVNGTIDSYNTTVIDSGVNTRSIIQTNYTGVGSSIFSVGDGVVQNHSVTIETPFVYFDSLWSEKEIKRIRLVHNSVGSPVITLTVVVKDSLNGTPRSELATLITDANFVNESIFQLRNIKVGKLISFKLTYNNTSADYVKSFIGMSLDLRDGRAEK